MSYMTHNQHFEPPPLVPNNPPPNTVRKPAPENKSSLLLSKEENQRIFAILGKGRQTLSTAVVQLLVPTPDQRQWQKKETGVMCFVRDQAKKSYFIQVLSLRTDSMVFRQEIYNQFEYQMPEQFFLTFEGDNSMVGINFADTTEASNFREVLDNKLETKRQRRNERRSRILENQNSQIHTNHVATTPAIQSSTVSVPNGATPITSSNFYNNFKLYNKKGRKEKDKKKILRKEDISEPRDFRHVQHVGWDPNKGYDLEGVDSDLQTFFEKVGVSANDLKNKKTAQFIYNFIEEHGGVEAVKNELSSKQLRNDFNSSLGSTVSPPTPPNIHPPPVPARHNSSSISNVSNKLAAPPPPPPPSSKPPDSYLQNSVVPPPPPRNTHNNFSSPSIQNRTPPPPPSSSYHSSPSPMRPPVPQHHQQQLPDRSNNSSSSFQNGIPPPPPPPPLPPAMPPPLETYAEGISHNRIEKSTNNNNNNNIDSGGDDRSALMNQIKTGVQLKKVSVDSQSMKKPSGTIADCLNQIKEGVGLKPVPETAKVQPPPDAVDGLAGALARALAERSRAINPSDSDSEADEDEFDDDEWD